MVAIAHQQAFGDSATHGLIELRHRHARTLGEAPEVKTAPQAQGVEHELKPQGCVWDVIAR